MQLRRLRHAIRQTAASKHLTRDTRRDDEDSTRRVGVEGRRGLTHQNGLRLDVHGVAEVPVLSRCG